MLTLCREQRLKAAAPAPAPAAAAAAVAPPTGDDGHNHYPLASFELQSDIGLTPNNDGRVIRLQVPQLTAVGGVGRGAGGGLSRAEQQPTAAAVQPASAVAGSAPDVGGRRQCHMSAFNGIQ